MEIESKFFEDLKKLRKLKYIEGTITLTESIISEKYSDLFKEEIYCLKLSIEVLFSLFQLFRFFLLKKSLKTFSMEQKEFSLPFSQD
jgi:hypothetical protein